MELLKKPVVQLSEEELMRRVIVNDRNIEKMFKCLRRVIGKEKSNRLYTEKDVKTIMDDVRETLKQVTEK